MRFYQLAAKKLKLDPQGDNTECLETQWFGTERAAIIERNSMFKAGKLSGLKRTNEILLVDIPTDKAGLLKFLQDNVTSLVVV